MPLREQAPPRVITIEGRRALVIERRPPLPPRLQTLLEYPGMRLYPLKITGWRGECSMQDHRLKLIAEGRVLCPDNERRDLRVYQCADCESVCIRDLSVDSTTGYDPEGRGALRPRILAPRRRNHVLGWYSGSRKQQRTYR
jgi:hypothetical protein